MNQETDRDIARNPNDPSSLLNGRFRILEKIGEGGFAITYRGQDEQTGSDCVIKELSMKLVEDWKMVELFEREARVLKQLDHSRIPKFLDFFTVKNDQETRIYLVQQFIRGTNLAELIKQGKHFTEKEVVGIALQITHILEYLQNFSPPIIHRDIKPSNILIDEENQAYLIDFGAVRDKVLHTQRTEAAGFTVIGTYGYMPFEQFQGRAVPSSDLYSLGATMISVLSHKEPHEMDHLGSRLEFEHHMRASKDLEMVLRKLTEPQLENRYAAASQLRPDLEAILAGRPVHVAAKPAISSRLGRVLAVASLVVGLLAALVFTKLNMEKRREITELKTKAVQRQEVPDRVEPPAVAGQTIRGRILFDGAPVGMLNPPSPSFWFRNETSGRVQSAAAEYKDSTFIVQGLQEGEFGMSIQFDLNPRNPLSYPGDLRSWTTFSVQEGSNSELIVELQKIIHMRKPQDNGAVMKGWGAEWKDMISFQDPVEFAWDSLGEDVYYDYRVSRIEMPYKFKDSAAGGTTSGRRITLPLSPSQENEFYLLEITARRQGRRIGMLMTHGSNGYGWDFRFRVR